MPLPDEGIKIAALPAASSPDAIDLVGVQAGVTKKLASTLLATQAELDAVNLAAAHLAGVETFTGAKSFAAQATTFGLGAAAGAGAYLQIDGDATQTYIRCFGSPANIGIHIQPKGTGIVNIALGPLAIDAGSVRVGGDSGGVAGYTTLTNAFAIGNAAAANLTSPAKGTGGGPTSLVTGQWVKIYLGGAVHWVPAFS